MFDFIGRAYAQIETLPGVTPLGTGDTGSITEFVIRIANWVMFAAGALVLIYLIYGGILYVTAGGDAEKATKGRTAVINAVIGLIIVLLALVIMSWVNSALISVG